MAVHDPEQLAANLQVLTGSQAFQSRLNDVQHQSEQLQQQHEAFKDEQARSVLQSPSCLVQPRLEPAFLDLQAASEEALMLVQYLHIWPCLKRVILSCVTRYDRHGCENCLPMSSHFRCSDISSTGPLSGSQKLCCSLMLERQQLAPKIAKWKAWEDSMFCHSLQELKLLSLKHAEEDALHSRLQSQVWSNNADRFAGYQVWLEARRRAWLTAAELLVLLSLAILI